MMSYVSVTVYISSYGSGWPAAFTITIYDYVERGGPTYFLRAAGLRYYVAAALWDENATRVFYQQGLKEILS